MSDLVERLKSYRPHEGEWGDKTHHLICDEASEALDAMREALTSYIAAVDVVNSAMKDGVNVHGALAALVGAEGLAEYALSLYDRSE